MVGTSFSVHKKGYSALTCYASTEENACHKSAMPMRKRLKLRPTTATALRNGRKAKIAVGELLVGDIVIVKPGEKIPADGIVTAGYSSVDEELFTGETTLVEKNVGSKVIGATINKAGTIQFRITKVGEDTVLAQVMRLVEEA